VILYDIQEVKHAIVKSVNCNTEWTACSIVT